MFLVRLFLWLITLPFVCLAHAFKLILFLFTFFGSIVTTLFGGVIFLGSAAMLVACFWQSGVDFWSGFGIAAAGMALGLLIYFLPRLGMFLVSLLDGFIDWAHYISF